MLKIILKLIFITLLITQINCNSINSKNIQISSQKNSKISTSSRQNDNFYQEDYYEDYYDYYYYDDCDYDYYYDYYYDGYQLPSNLGG